MKNFLIFCAFVFVALGGLYVFLFPGVRKPAESPLILWEEFFSNFELLSDDEGDLYYGSFKKGAASPEALEGFCQNYKWIKLIWIGEGVHDFGHSQEHDDGKVTISVKTECRNLISGPVFIFDNLSLCKKPEYTGFEKQGSYFSFNKKPFVRPNQWQLAKVSLFNSEDDSKENIATREEGDFFWVSCD